MPIVTPGFNNFSAALFTTRPSRRIAALFRPPVWSVRASSWTDYEVASDFAELELQDASRTLSPPCMLLGGEVTDVTINGALILGILRAAEIPFKAECYAEEDDEQPTQEWRWSPD